jgi:protein tyrosine phosphatase (PTP) superfamily phosphohydrolase (DUF442 family)
VNNGSFTRSVRWSACWAGLLACWGCSNGLAGYNLARLVQPVGQVCQTRSPSCLWVDYPSGSSGTTWLSGVPPPWELWPSIEIPAFLRKVRRVKRRLAPVLIWSLVLSLGLGSGILLASHRDIWFEKRVQVVVPGQLVRGAWQRPGPLRRIISREAIKTIVTLTAINSADPKFHEQAEVVRETGVRWVVVPMRGSRATPEQMALAADLLADPARQPVFFHCVAGHHRTSLAHAAYLIRHRGYTADQAWQAVSRLQWARPDSVVDRNDRFLIEEFARVQRSLAPSSEQGVWEIGHEAWPHATGQVVRKADGARSSVSLDVDRLESGDVQLRGPSAGTDLPIGTDVSARTSANPS